MTVAYLSSLINELLDRARDGMGEGEGTAAVSYTLVIEAMVQEN